MIVLGGSSEDRARGLRAVDLKVPPLCLAFKALFAVYSAFDRPIKSNAQPPAHQVISFGMDVRGDGHG